MIFLHSPESEVSRNLFSNIPEGVEVVNWSVPAEATAYLAQADAVSPSAFPAVIVDAPERTIQSPKFDEMGNMIGIGDFTIPARKEEIRMPVSWDVVNEYVAFINSVK